MSDEQQMNMVEILSEELGEKELKIMTLEKELEKEKKLRIQMTEICQIKQFELTYREEIDSEGFDDAAEIIDILFYNSSYFPSFETYDKEMKYRILDYYFQGSINKKEEIMEENVEENWEEFIEHSEGNIYLTEGNNYWHSLN